MPNQFQLSIHRALSWLKSQLNEDGSYNNYKDLAYYYKSPLLFAFNGELELANLILDYMKKTFMQADGDFLSEGAKKSINPSFEMYWTYMNGWIAMSAQRLGRFDVAYPAFDYLQSYYQPKMRTFTQKSSEVDVLTAAHMGLTLLFFGKLEVARNVGLFLFRMLDEQKGKPHFLLKKDEAGKFVENYQENQAFLYSVDSKQPNQAFFMLGYPAAFLAKLYLATNEPLFLETAKGYLDFAMTCRGVKEFFFSHKVSWASALIGMITQEEKYQTFAIDIAQYLIKIQDPDGCWLKDEATDMTFDQTVEIALWLKEVSCLIPEKHYSSL